MDKIKLLAMAVWVLCGLNWSVVAAQPIPRRSEERFLPSQGSPHEEELAAPLDGEEEPRFRRGRVWRDNAPRGKFSPEDFQQRREERRRRVERARNMTSRLLQNPDTPEDAKTQARRLSELLDRWDRLEQKLSGKRQEFLRNHQQEIDELRQLQERAERLRHGLRDAREKVMADNVADIQEMRRVTQEARDIAQELRQQYQGRRR